jgi:hypothetical protein
VKNDELYIVLVFRWWQKSLKQVKPMYRDNKSKV